MPALDVIATTVAGMAVVGGVALAEAFPSNLVGQYFEYVVASLAALALAGVLVRALWSGGGGKSAGNKPVVERTPTDVR